MAFFVETEVVINGSFYPRTVQMLADYRRQRPLSLLHLQQHLLLAPQNSRDKFVNILIRIIGEAGRSMGTQKISQASNRAQTRRQFRAQKTRGQIS